MQSLTQRMLGAAKLDIATYEEVEHDRGATAQAALVIVLTVFAAGIAAFIANGAVSLLQLIAISLANLLGWAVLAGVIWLVGTKMLPEAQTEADLGQLFRTLGFATTPGLLRVFGWIPVIGPLLLLVVMLWTLATMVIAVRQALDYRSTLRAVGVCVIGWLIYLLIMAVLLGVAGMGASPATTPTI